LATHFESNPRDLNILQHDKSIGTAQVQPHLATIPDYLVPIALQAAVPSIKRPKKQRHHTKRDQRRRTDNDPLHTFTHEEGQYEGGEVGDEKEKKETIEDRITYGNTGVGKSSAGRQKWKQQHRKGRFNPRTIAKKKYKMSKGHKH
jgi:ATP-dependent RNA helicase DDX56/DBP9